MATEIERKFLVTSLDFKEQSTSSISIKQGYLSRTPERSVRVRLANSLAYLTIKGVSNKSGVSRYEWEREIPFAEAQELLKICEPGVIEKTRYIVPLSKKTRHLNSNHNLTANNSLQFEVDEFHGCHAGLIIAEIELQYESQEFPKPSWLGQEVTGNPIYYNSQL